MSFLSMPGVPLPAKDGITAGTTIKTKPVDDLLVTSPLFQSIGILLVYRWNRMIYILHAQNLPPPKRQV
jgi:hypothetical protein